MDVLVAANERFGRVYIFSLYPGLARENSRKKIQERPHEILDNKCQDDDGVSRPYYEPQRMGPNSLAEPPPIAGSISSHAGWPDPRPQDVRTVESTVAELHDVISAPVGSSATGIECGHCSFKLIPVRMLLGSPDSAHLATDAVYFTASRTYSGTQNDRII